LHAALLDTQNADGGFGARPGLPSATEPTAVALLALSSEVDRRGVLPARTWLRAYQTPDHGWPVAAGLVEASWTTALAVLALAPYPEDDGAVQAGAQWLAGRRGRALGDPLGLLRRLLGMRPVVALDGTLVGWPWVGDTFSWVEPTSYALLALQAVRPRSAIASARLAEGARLLHDRVCHDGGWNYGNTRVLGEDLWGYPDTTALALLALRESSAGTATTTQGLTALRGMLGTNESGLATALGVLALAAYGQEVRPLRERLRVRFARTRFTDDVRALAWAVLASNPDAAPFKGTGGA
jgi:hypothetical protein